MSRFFFFVVVVFILLFVVQGRLCFHFSSIVTEAGAAASISAGTIACCKSALLEGTVTVVIRED